VSAVLLGLAVLVLVGVPVPPRLRPTRPARRWPRPGARRRAEAAERASSLEVLDALVGELAAGRSPEVALLAAAEVAQGGLATALRSAAACPSVGADPAAALRQGAEGSAVPEVLHALATCWQVCAGAGSSLAAAVAQLAEAVTAEHAVRREVAAEVAGPRATAALLAGLPLLGLALAAALGAHPLHVLLATPLGLGCLVTGVALDALGWWWTGRIVAGVLRP